jgi:tripartite-type tricarboxylate transporter receptor subunit TctC
MTRPFKDTSPARPRHAANEPVDSGRRTLLRGLAGTGLAAATTLSPWASSGALAQAGAYPNRPIKLIVPYPPGGNTDLVARLYAVPLATALGQPVIVENRGGAAASIGMSAAAKSPADGYTLVIGDVGSLCINRFAQPNLPYDPVKDFAPVSLLSTVSIVVTARPDFPASTFPEFLALARANPGKYACATAGAGTIGHLSLELLMSMANIQLRHVPYKGGAPALTDLLGGHVDLMIDGAALSQARTGKIKALAVTGERIGAMPQVPTIAESGVPGYRLSNFWGYLMPAGTPKDIVERISTEVQRIAVQAAVRDRLTEGGITATGSSPQVFSDLIRSENEKIGGIIKTAKITFQ